MPGFIEQVERDTDALFAEAGFSQDEPPSICELSVALLGTFPTYADIDQSSFLMWANGRWQIEMAESQSLARTRHAAAVALATWWYYSHERWGGMRMANELALSILMPRESFLSEMDERGDDVHALASEFGTPESLVLLRIGMLTGRLAILHAATGELAYRGRPTIRNHRMRIEMRDEPGQWGELAS